MVALLSGEDVFLNNIHDSERRGDALTAHAKFENEFGDHLTLLNVFKAYAKSERPKTWSHDNFLNVRNLNYALEVRNQLSEICFRLNLEFSSCGSKFDQVRADFSVSYFFHAYINAKNVSISYLRFGNVFCLAYSLILPNCNVKIII